MENRRFYQELILKPEHFDHPSQLHGIGHTYRVMILVYRISKTIGRQDLLQLSLAAAYIHDMARQHDGYCSEHGSWAAEQKLPGFSEFFFSFGVSKDDLLKIATAVAYHSMREELDPGHPASQLTAILKDGDALDRIRLSEDNLDERFLRFPESADLIEFAKALYFSSHKRIFYNFAEALEFAELINLK